MARLLAASDPKPRHVRLIGHSMRRYRNGLPLQRRDISLRLPLGQLGVNLTLIGSVTPVEV